jgi:hypothetical protein
MATSGAADFTLTLDELVEEAFERAGREARSGYDFRTARRSLNLLLTDWANRGLNLWTVEEREETLVAGTATYDLDADVVDIVEQVIRTESNGSQFDRHLTRMHLNTYARMTNKETEGQPLQMYVKRGVGNPAITLWPVPDDATTYTLVYWVLRRMENAGNAVNTQDVPFRLYPALVAGLAYYIAQKLPEGQDRIQRLEAEYERAWMRASDEDRDRSSVFLRPKVSL